MVPVTTSAPAPVDVHMPSAVAITGYVYGPNGTPALANIGVNANSNTYGTGTQTDINGYYSLAVPPNGAYTLQFNDNSPTPIYLNGCYIDSPTANFTTDQGACDQVQVNAVDVGPINVSMPSAVHITGTVYGPGGSTGLVGIHVNANAGNLGFGAQTDINGYYSLTVPSGSYTLQFNDSTGHHLSGCYDSNNSPRYFTTNQQNLCTPVQVEGSNVPGKDVWMPDGVAISGTVTGPGGTPALTNVWVGTNGAGTQTDINGYYSLAVPPNGAYTLQFNDNSGTHASGCYDSNNSPSYFPTNQPNGCPPGDVITSDVGPINVSMPLGLHITGHVFGPGGQTPLEGIGVNTNGAGAQTDINGYYSLTVPSGSYTLQFNDN